MSRRVPDRRIADTRPGQEPGPILPLWAAFIAAAAAGALMDVAYPGVAFWPAAYIAPTLLLIALIGRSWAGALVVGLVFGLVFFALLVSWTARFLGPIPWAALTVAEGGLTGMGLLPVTLAYRWLPRVAPGSLGRLGLLPLLIAALWTGREVVLGAWPYGGLPWARLGMTQSESPVAELASWVGAGGLGFLMMFTIAATIEWLRTRSWRRPLQAAVPLTAASLLLMVPAFPTTAAGTLRIGAVQGNGPSGYFDEREPWAIAQAQERATAPLYGEALDLLVWPEGLDTDPFDSDYLARSLTRVSERTGAPLLANAATSVGSKIYNTSILWDTRNSPTPTREQLQTHAKRNPVPFGEYVPDREFYNALVPDLIGLIQREYSPGADLPLVTVEDVRIGLAICFDVIYDEVIAESIRSGAQILVFQTNNADFRDTDENVQQLAFARMRAIETGRSVVNISTVGPSQIIRPDGTTTASLPSGQAGTLRADVELRTGVTPGVVIGQTASWSLLWCGLAGLILTGLLARRWSTRSESAFAGKTSTTTTVKKTGTDQGSGRGLNITAR